MGATAHPDLGRQGAEEALRETRLRLAAIVEYALDAIVTIEHRGTPHQDAGGFSSSPISGLF